MCRLYLYIYPTSHIPLFTLLFFSPRLQMRVCTEQIRRTQPRTEGTESARSEGEESAEEEEEEEEADRHTALMSLT